MKKILLASIILASASSTSAFAADIGARITKAPAAVPVGYNWSGFYVGANLGYGWGNNTADVNFVDTGGGAVGFPDPSLQGSSKGIIGGAQIGYNFQWGGIVFGLETDIQGSGFSGSALVAPLPGAVNATPDPTFVSTDQKVSWFGTARARLGFAVTPNLLLYGTGGAAYGGIKVTADGVDSVVNQSHLSGSLDEIKFGWTAGAGAEWMFARNWSAKIEYLYLDLGHATTFAQNTSVLGANFTWAFKENIVRAGVNYHF